MFKMHRLHRNFPLLALLFVLTGCGGLIDRYSTPVADDTVQEIFEAGNDAMYEKRYRQAAVYFAEIKDDYPFSPYVIEAELSLGDALFLNEQYLLAADAYRDFEELHPRHEAIPYVLLQVARSMRNTYKSVDRATTELEVGYEYAQRLVAEYPGTEYAVEAQKEVTEIRLLLAKREVYIAQLYSKMGNHEAAWNRYAKVAKTYPDITEIYAYAVEQGNASFMKHREESSEDEREERVGSWKEWVDWL